MKLFSILSYRQKIEKLKIMEKKKGILRGFFEDLSEDFF